MSIISGVSVLLAGDKVGKVFNYDWSGCRFKAWGAVVKENIFFPVSQWGEVTHLYTVLKKNWKIQYSDVQKFFE